MYLPAWQRFSQTSSTLFWVCCAAVALAFSWLLPNHQPPLHEFFNDVWIAGFLAGVYVWALVTKRLPQQLGLPLAAVLMLALSMVPLVQWATGLLHYSGQALLSTSYLLAAAMAISLAYALSPTDRAASINLLLGAILLASLANAIVLFIQKTGLFPRDNISFPGFLVFEMRGARLVGNLGQANQMATLLVWGLLSAWWFWHTLQLRLYGFVAASAILAMALLCTQSRIAYLNIFILACLGVCALLKISSQHRTARPKARPLLAQFKFAVLVPVIWLVLIFVCYAILYAIEYWFDLNTELRSDLLADPVRRVIYPLFLKASLNHFWFGYGWTHLARVQMDLPLDGIELGVYFLHSHNIFIDLLLWTGVPIGLAVIGSILWGMVWLFIKIDTLQSYILTCLLVVLLGHAAVEFPHMYGYFLLPAAWILGVLAAQLKVDQPSAAAVRLTFRRGYMHSVTMLLVLILVACVWDHVNISRELMWIRLKSAKIKISETAQVDPAIILNHFEDRLRMQSLAPTKGASQAHLAWARKAALGYPAPVTHYNLICLLAVNGHADEAQVWMHRLNRIAPKNMAQGFIELWDGFRKEHAALALATWPVSGSLLFNPPEKSTAQKQP